MANLQGQQIAGILGEQAVEAAAHTGPVARRPGAQGANVHALAVVAPVVEIVEPRQAGLDFRNSAAFPQGQVDLAAKDMTHDEVGIGLEGLVDNRHRIAAINAEE